MISMGYALSSFCQIRQVAVHLAAQGARHEAGLYEGQQGDGGIFFSERMGDFLLFACLPSGDHFAPTFVVEHHRIAFTVVEIDLIDLPSVDQSKRQSVGQHGAELLLEVEGQCRAAGAHGMQKAELGVEANALQGRAAVVHEQSVEE